MSKVELKTISELLDKKFVVPYYQRGYRWDRQQVRVCWKISTNSWRNPSRSVTISIACSPL